MAWKPKWSGLQQAASQGTLGRGSMCSSKGLKEGQKTRPHGASGQPKDTHLGEELEPWTAGGPKETGSSCSWAVSATEGSAAAVCCPDTNMTSAYMETITSWGKVDPARTRAGTSPHSEGLCLPSPTSLPPTKKTHGPGEEGKR